MTEKVKFEKCLIALQDVIKKLESEDLSFDEMVDLYEEGTRLMKLCKSELKVVENRIENISEKNIEFLDKEKDS